MLWTIAVCSVQWVPSHQCKMFTVGPCLYQPGDCIPSEVPSLMLLSVVINPNVPGPPLRGHLVTVSVQNDEVHVGTSIHPLSAMTRAAGT